MMDDRADMAEDSELREEPDSDWDSEV